MDGNLYSGRKQIQNYSTCHFHPFNLIESDWFWLILIAMCVRLVVEPRHWILRLELMLMGRDSHVSTRQAKLAATREINVHSAICPMRQIRAQWPEEFVNIHVTALKKECLRWKLSETFNFLRLIKLWPGDLHTSVPCKTVPQLCPAPGTRASRYLVCAMGFRFWSCNCPHFWGAGWTFKLCLSWILSSYALSCLDLFGVLRSMKTSLTFVPLQVVCDPQFPQGLEAPSSSGGPGRCPRGFTGRSSKASFRAEIGHQISRRSSRRASEHFVPGAEISTLKGLFACKLFYRFCQVGTVWAAISVLLRPDFQDDGILKDEGLVHSKHRCWICSQRQDKIMFLWHHGTLYRKNMDVFLVCRPSSLDLLSRSSTVPCFPQNLLWSCKPE